MTLPEPFQEKMRALLGEGFRAFADSLQEPAPVSIRLHPLKHANASPIPSVPWCSMGRYLPERPVFTLDPLFHAGSYYVQEASSMFLGHALKQFVEPDKPLNILDLCAAPGGKSTHILSLINRESLLVSNEVIRSRASILSENIQKWGYPNCVVTNNDPADFQKLPGFFDVMIVDAPCSGEGLFRKDPEAISEWSPENVQLCCGRQKRILADAWGALKENGILIYCTCTYNDDEDEGTLRWMAANHAVAFQKVALDPVWCVEEISGDNLVGYRFFPHRVRGEGFFLSVMRKAEYAAPGRLKTKKSVAVPATKIRERAQSWITTPEASTFFQFNDLIFYTPAAKAAEVSFLLQNFHILYAGTNVATLKHDKLIPAHALALSVALRQESFASADLPEAEAIRYLRKDAIQLEGTATGFTLITYKDVPIGWANVLANRVNNLYPSDWRIRKSFG